MPGPWLLIEPAAEYLYVVPETLRKYAREGRIPCARVGGRLLFSQEDLDEFIRANTTPARRDEAL